MMRRTKMRGFTLLELMITLVIIAVLAAIALPSYRDSVRKGRRGDAKAVLTEVAQIAERYRTTNNTYAGTSAALGVPTTSPKTGTAYYQIDYNGTATTFTATATPKAGTDQVEDKCGVLTINQTGAKFHEKGTDMECAFGITGP